MGFRDFRDSTGVRWQAWDVIPRLLERRQAARRAATRQGMQMVDERRSGMDRRIMSTRRASLGPGLERGWLCFESSAEKRRLAPIPADWMRCREAELERYCREAAPVLAAADLRITRELAPVQIPAVMAAAPAGDEATEHPV